MKKSCKNCYYSRLTEQGKLECRYNPPAEEDFPEMLYEDWCGKWLHKEMFPDEDDIILEITVPGTYIFCRYSGDEAKVIDINEKLEVGDHLKLLIIE